MSAKSSKQGKAAARTAKRKVQATAIKPAKPARRPKTASIVEVEVVEDVPNLMPGEVGRQVEKVEKQVCRADHMSDARILEMIANYSTEASNYSGIALKAGASALVYAWGCGCLLNAAKERLGHGEFGKWRKEHIEGKYISLRTSMRYMKLASRCQDIRGLLQWAPSLKQAYVECGILPPSPDREEEIGEDAPDAVIVRRKRMLLAGVTRFQQGMQRWVDVKGRLDAEERRQLRRARQGIDSFFTSLLG